MGFFDRVSSALNMDVAGDDVSNSENENDNENENIEYLIPAGDSWMPISQLQGVDKDEVIERVQSEDFTVGGGNLFDYVGGAAAISNPFLWDIYKRKRRRPHDEMKEIRKMRVQNAFVEAAVETVGDLILGKEQCIESDDEDTRKWFESFFEDSGMWQVMRIAAKDFISYGNFYFERRRGRVSNLVRRYNAIAHPERVWKRMSGDEVTSYVLEIPHQLVNQADKNEGVKQYRVGYGLYEFYTVYGVEYSDDELKGGSLGQGSVSHYGRSPLASALDDHKVLREIERSMAVFARYKSIPKKVVSMMGVDGEELSRKDFRDTMQRWRQTSDLSNFVVNGKQFDIHDLDYAGSQPSFNEMLQYFKRKITSTLAPEFYLHGETTNYAVSRDQKTTFYLRVQAWRNQFLKPFLDELQDIVEERNAADDLFSPDIELSDDVSIRLGAFDFETDEEKREKAMRAFGAGAITVNEARELLGLEPADDEQVGKAFSWELKTQEPAAMLQQKLNDLEQEQEREQERERIRDEDGSL